jgi:phage tail-like protein
MSKLPKRYLFGTAVQWAAGLLTGGAFGASGFAPAQGLASAPQLVWSGDANALAATVAGEVYWRDATGTLHWLSDGDPPEICGDAPSTGALGQARLIVVTGSLLWVAGADPTTITAYDRRSFQQLAETAPGGDVRDIAGDHHGVAALIADSAGPRVVHASVDGRVQPVPLPPLDGNPALLARAGARFVVADFSPSRLRWGIPAERTTGTWVDLPFDTLGHGAGLTATALASFPGTGVALVCSDRLILLSPDGTVIKDAALPATIGVVHDVAAAGAAVWLATATGLWRWDLIANEDGTSPAEASFLTPTLRSPLGVESGWLRAEIEATLPPGATLACHVASGDGTLAGQAQVIIANATLAPAAKVAQLLALLPWSQPIQVGAGLDQPAAATPSPAPDPFVLPLHNVTDEYLWLRLVVTGSAGTQVGSLGVLYPQLSLMQRLPAIYQAAPRPHLRGLVALFDAIEQGLDRRIATLGSLNAADTAPDGWLDYLASWLGLPWEAGVSADIRRAMLVAAPDLLATRGTVAGLRQLLGVLLPGRPVRLTDAAGFTPALLPRPGEAGSAAAPILLGRSQDITRLNVAVLGKTRLRPCGPQDDPLLRMSGWLVIKVGATDTERSALGDALSRLVAAYVPAGVSPVLRWLTWPPGGAGRRLDEDLTLQSERAAVLGQDIHLGGITLGGIGPMLRDGIDFSDNDRLL